jgi:hypothetical protein
MSRKKIIPIGAVFARLTVIGEAEPYFGPNGYKKYRVICRCECGTMVIAKTNNLRGGITTSCGCLRKELLRAMRTTHGLANTVMYRLWADMRNRCNNPRHHAWKNYGGRGIRVCERWNQFENFLKDMGERPEDHFTLERIDNASGYSPENVYWATPIEQANNKRNNHNLTYKGETFSIFEWARRKGMRPKTLFNRIKRGWAVEDALTCPVQVQYRRPRLP